MNLYKYANFKKVADSNGLRPINIYLHPFNYNKYLDEQIRQPDKELASRREALLSEKSRVEAAKPSRPASVKVKESILLAFAKEDSIERKIAPGKSVLIVEDDGYWLDRVRAPAMETGYFGKALSAASYESAVDALNKNSGQISCVITDGHIIGEETGLDIIRFLKSRGFEGAIIMQTSDNDFLRKALLLGADAVINKYHVSAKPLRTLLQPMVNVQ